MSRLARPRLKRCLAEYGVASALNSLSGSLSDGTDEMFDKPSPLFSICDFSFGMRLQQPINMARRKFIPDGIHPYHVCNRVHNKSKYPLPIDTVWKIVCDELILTHHLYSLQIHSFVLMENHYHMIASTPDANLDRCMLFFQTNVSKKLNEKSGKLNQIFGGRYSRTLIREESHYNIAYKYVYRNPVEAKLCNKVEEYKYSTLQMYLGLSAIDIPVLPDDRIVDETQQTLNWLNSSPKKSDYNAVKKAFSYDEFQLGITRDTRKKIEILDY
jgi:REP element-mobilizing transposase RayT